MQFKDSFAQNQTLRFVYEHLAISSNLGRNALLSMPFLTSATAIENEYVFLDTMVQLIGQPENNKTITHLRQQLHQVNDIRPTLTLLAGNAVMDDIQLFEIKKNALLTAAIVKELDTLQCTLFDFDNTESVVTLLDPEHTRIPHFYIYSIYDDRLADLRAQVQSTQTANEAEPVKCQIQQIEDAVRAGLSEKLRTFQPSLVKNITLIAHLDLLIAKAKMAIEMKACHPKIAETTCFQQLLNPEVAEALAVKGRQFQPLDVSFKRETVLVTGANMAGKSVLLKTVSLAQYMFQFAFYVPAQSATMTVVDEILCSIGDKQSEISGLSSFAVEILTINTIIQEAKKGKRLLALVDELARTTNPEEGKRLVNGFLLMMNKLKVTALVTTHYSGITTPCYRLRVKGLQLGTNSHITAGTIADYMDYGLVETTEDEVPKEAFTIAKLLKVDEDFLKACQRDS